MYFVLDYNHRDYSQESWAEDIELIKDLEIDVVRIIEFQWDLIEKEAGNYDFSFYDKIIDCLRSYGINIILGTPSVRPPAWLNDSYCLNSLSYLKQAKKITAKVVERYQNKTNLIGWQIDNKLSIKDMKQCYCDDCKKRFQIWLKKKYQKLEELNSALGTGFWNKSYNSWEEVSIPQQKWTTYSPSLLLDFYRFLSDTINNYQKLQLEIVKHRVEGDWIREDFILTGNKFNYQKLKLTEPFDAKRAVSNKLNDLQEQIFWRLEDLIEIRPQRSFNHAADSN
ncbi:MAG: beta-galactosidase [Halanaerobacter sp.]